METTYIYLIILSPFAGFLINLIGGERLGKTIPGVLGTFTVTVSFITSLSCFFRILSTGQVITIHLFDWFTLNEIRIGLTFILDQLSLLWLLIVTGIGALIHLYSIGYMKEDKKQALFFSYLNLFIFFMALLVTGNNLLVMFMGWEGVGLCSYLLIGFWHKNQAYNDAAKKAFIMNRIGDFGFVIGIFTLAHLFKTVDFETLKLAITTTSTPETTGLLSVAAFFLFTGAMGKSAQIPLYTWLPDAMAGPTPVSALIHAATMVTAGIFMVVRMNFLFDATPNIRLMIAVVGAVTALFAASIGLAQTDIKKTLAYSTISQLGLMFLAAGLGAYHIAVFHVITHAFFKACLFLGAGSVIHAMGGEQDMRRMGGLKKVLGVTYVTFLISSLSMAGIPPFAGFFSKDEIMMTAMENNPFLWVIAALASLMTAIYIFRILFLTFFNDFRGDKNKVKHLHESPSVMTVPLIVLAVLAIIGGAISLPFGRNWLNEFLAPIVPQVAEHAHVFGTRQIVVMAISVAIALTGTGIAYYMYGLRKRIPVADDKKTGFVKILYNKYYVDEIYDRLFVKPVYMLDAFFRKNIEPAIHRLVLGIGSSAKILSVPLSALQNGSIGFYLFVFVIGFCSILYVLFFT
jgi:proton-translocating NADH-quinone oxidoreductase, chain L